MEYDYAIRRLLTLVLTKEGFEVQEVSGANAAVELLAITEPFDLIVVDYTVTASGAAGVIAHLKESMPDTLRRVIVITGAPHIIRHGLPERVCLVLAKPFSLDRFLEAVRHCRNS